MPISGASYDNYGFLNNSLIIIDQPRIAEAVTTFMMHISLSLSLSLSNGEEDAGKKDEGEEHLMRVKSVKGQ